MWKHIALVCSAVAVVVAILWSFALRSEPQLPKMPSRPVPTYLAKRQGPPPPPPPPPTWEEFVAKVNGRPAPGARR